MLPLLAIPALSAVSSVTGAIADKISGHPATTAQSSTPAVPFSTLMNQVAATTQATAAAKAQCAQDLTTKLSQSPEVSAAINAAGVAGPFNLQIDAQGNATLRLPNGGAKPVQFSNEMRGLAQQLYQLRQVNAPASTASTVTRPSVQPPVTITVGQ